MVHLDDLLRSEVLKYEAYYEHCIATGTEIIKEIIHLETFYAM